MSPHRERRLLQVTLEDIKAKLQFADTILDETNVERMREELAELGERLAGCHAYLDLGNVEFLTSSWLGLFVSLCRELRAAGGRMTLLNVSPEIYEVFVATRLTVVLDVREQGSLAGRPELDHSV